MKVNIYLNNVFLIKDENGPICFEKHVSNFCNFYHDFDQHSEDHKSYLVNFYKNKKKFYRNLTGPIMLII